MTRMRCIIAAVALLASACVGPVGVPSDPPAPAPSCQYYATGISYPCNGPGTITYPTVGGV